MTNPTVPTILVTIVSAVVIAMLTAAVGFLFQLISSKIERRRNKRDLEMKRAEDIYKNVSTSMDKLYYQMNYKVFDKNSDKCTLAEGGSSL